MYKNKKILALIPARGASKRIPHKNIKLLLGEPLIARTIEQAKKSRYIDSIVVSTDDKKIAGISRNYGAEVPFIRPRRLALDTAKGIDVVLQAINWLKKNGREYDLVVLLQPTSPLRASTDIDNAIELLFSKSAKAVISVCESGHKPLWSDVLPKSGCMRNFMKKNKQSSNAPQYYTLNGAIYLGYCSYIKKHKGFLGARTFAYIMPQERSVDIDSEFDFWIAEQFLSNSANKQALRMRND